jgi:uncharacterized membrane protein HdeD (DUF308 family)
MITSGGNAREGSIHLAHPRTPSMLAALSENWWALVVRGLLAVLFGCAALFLQLDTLEAVGRLITEGASGIVAGLVALAWPSITALMLLYVVAIWAILSGVAEMIAAVSLRREIEGEWVLFLVGVLSVLLGAAMAVLPGVGLLSLVWLVGLYALAVGIALIMLAFRVRGLRSREGRRVA